MARKADRKQTKVVRKKVGFEKFEEIVKENIGKRFSEKDLEQNRRDLLKKLRKQNNG